MNADFTSTNMNGETCQALIHARVPKAWEMFGRQRPPRPKEVQGTTPPEGDDGQPDVPDASATATG